MTISKAIYVAKIAHYGQLRKDEKTPYINHPANVVKLLCLYSDIIDEDIIMAAWLHDILEDTTYDEISLFSDFGPSVYHLVKSLTNCFKVEYCDWPRKDRKKAEHIRLGQCDHKVQIIKCADRLDNILDLNNGIFDDKSRFVQIYLQETLDLFSYLTKIHNTKLSIMLMDNINKKLD